METQNERLLARLRRGPINPLAALAELGIMRLGARIYDLKAEGYRIETELVEVRTRFGTKSRIAHYTLKA